MLSIEALAALAGCSGSNSKNIGTFGAVAYAVGSNGTSVLIALAWTISTRHSRVLVCAWCHRRALCRDGRLGDLDGPRDFLREGRRG